MNHYEIWFNLKNSHKDLEFVTNLRGFLDHLKSQGRIAGFRLTRRKFGFGPPELGEFHVSIQAETLAQLDSAFDGVAPREGVTETLHTRVYAMVTDFKSALYRDFPDPVRKQAAGDERPASTASG